MYLIQWLWSPQDYFATSTYILHTQYGRYPIDSSRTFNTEYKFSFTGAHVPC